MSKASDSHTERQAVAYPRLKRKKKGYRRLPPGQRLLCFLHWPVLLPWGKRLNYRLIRRWQVPILTWAQESSLPMQGKINSLPMPYKMSADYTSLLNELKQESDKPKLRAGVFVLEPATGRYVDMAATEPFSQPA